MTTWQKYPHARGARPIDGLAEDDIVKYAEFLAGGLARSCVLLNDGKIPLAELRISVTLSPTVEFSETQDESGQDA